jgi:hypothetical protein
MAICFLEQSMTAVSGFCNHCSKEAVTWLNAGDGAQKISADKSINILPDQIS